MDQFSELTHRKIRAYFAANYLFARSLSHPQVVEMLSEYEPDTELLVLVVDAAMVDHWRTMFNEVQRLTSLGKTYHEIFNEVKSMYPDEEIVHFICTAWYRVQTRYMENFVESGTNILEGIQWLIISAIGLSAMFYFKFSLLSKIIWGAAFIAALITWLYGLQGNYIRVRPRGYCCNALLIPFFTELLLPKQSNRLLSSSGLSSPFIE